MKLVGINGYKRSGKGTCADMLANQNAHLITKQVGFADKVKVAGARALGYLDLSETECIGMMDVAKEHWLIEIRNEAGSHDFEVDTVTGRQYLQNIGTEMRKMFGADFWVDQVLPKPVTVQALTMADRMEVVRSPEVRTMNQLSLLDTFPGIDIVAITDLRFENEAQRILDLGGVTWRVNRPGMESDGHDSEQRLPDELITHEIQNDGSLEDLETEVTYASVETLS